MLNLFLMRHAKSILGQISLDSVRSESASCLAFSIRQVYHGLDSLSPSASLATASYYWSHYTVLDWISLQVALFNLAFRHTWTGLDTLSQVNLEEDLVPLLAAGKWSKAAHKFDHCLNTSGCTPCLVLLQQTWSILCPVDCEGQITG